MTETPPHLSKNHQFCKSRSNYKKSVASVDFLIYNLNEKINEYLQMIDGKRLKKLRKEHHYSANKLGEELGYSETTVYRWEKNDSLYDIEVVNKLAKLYEVPVAYILGKENETTVTDAETESVITADETEETENEPLAVEEKPAKNQLSLVKIGAIAAASTFAAFAVVTAIIILCVYFSPKIGDGAANAVVFNGREVALIIGIMISCVIVITTATVLIFYFIRKRRKEK